MTEDLEECADCPVQGACCRITVAVEDCVRVYSSYSCPHLLESGLCGNYEDRASVPWCVSKDDLDISWPSLCAHRNVGQDHILTVAEYVILKGGTQEHYHDLRRVIDASAHKDMLDNFDHDLKKEKPDTK